MRILFTTCSAAHYMAPPRLSDEQINCGPYFADVEIGGRYLSLNTGRGDYDLKVVASKLPDDQQPEMIVSLVDSGWLNRPLNLETFRCPKVLLVADTHHMSKPLLGMLNYAISQPYDRVVVLYTRHHLEILRSTGVRNLAWFPSLTFPHGDAVVRAARSEERAPRIALIGQSGVLHKRRLRMAGALAAAKLPLVLREAPQREALKFYGSSLITFNTTANGDLNVRAFEAMAAGSMLLMDRLTPESGIEALWQEGRHYVGYDSQEELIERARHCLNHPDEAGAIAANGARWFDEHFNEKRRRDAFMDLALNGRSLPEFAVPSPKKLQVNFGGDPRKITSSLLVYEQVQERHSRHETVTAWLDDGVPTDFDWMCGTLRRVNVTRGPAAAQAANIDFAVLSAAKFAKAAELQAQNLWCWDASPEDTAKLRGIMEGAGWTMLSPDVAFFSRKTAAADGGDKRATHARGLFLAGDDPAAFEAAKKAIAEDPRSAGSYLVMAELAQEVGNRGLFDKMLAKVKALAPDDPRPALMELPDAWEAGIKRRARRLLNAARQSFDLRDWRHAQNVAQLSLEADPKFAAAHVLYAQACLGEERRDKGLHAWRLQGRALNALRSAVELAPEDANIARELAIELRRAGVLGEATEAFRRVLALEPGDAIAWFGLGEALLANNDADAAAEAFEKGGEHAPQDQQLRLWLGHARKRQGRLDEALALHRAALGAVEQIRPRAPRRRVAFVVQHGPSWPCMASVHAAFAADPRWEATVIALPYDHPFYTRTVDERDAVFGFLAAHKIPHVRWDRFSLQPGFADVLFLQNPYDITRPAGWKTHDLLRLVPRLAYIPYAIEIGGGTENANLQLNLPTQQLAWRIFARSPQHRENFARHCLTGASHVVVTGHPKMDAVAAMETTRDVELDAFVGGRKAVLWNPQFDVRLNGTRFGGGYSTFLRWMDYLPGEFARRPDMAFILRPHPLFFAVLSDRGILSSTQVARFIQRCEAAGNVTIDRRGSYLPAFAASAAIITDASSFVLEYAATGKPILYLHNPHGPGLNADGRFVRDYCSTAETESEIARFLDEVAAGVDAKREARMAAYPEFMHRPEGGVGREIFRVIQQRLDEEEARETPLRQAV